MDPLPKNKIKFYFGKKFKNFCRQPFLKYLPALSAVFVLAIAVFGANFILKSLCQRRDFCFSSGLTESSSELFVQPAKNFVSEYPDMVLIGKNSLVGVSVPSTVNPQILAGLSGENEEENLGAAERNGAEIIEYIVKPGDNLSALAARFNISFNTILWVNNLTAKSKLKVGQKLIILPVSGVIHLVKKGETLSRLAKIYKTDLKKIISFNNLSSEGDIFIGDILVIPGGKKPAALPRLTSIPLADSYFIFPVQGKITQGAHGPFGNAVDIANKCGTPVIAAAGGTVQRAGVIRIGGKRITILHLNGSVTYYGHLSSIAVRPGQKVKTGEIIGYVGNTGYTIGITGCHLHFEVRGAKNFLTKYRVGSYLSWKK